MKSPASTWLRSAPLAAIGLLSLALLVWFVGPLLAIGADRPLETRSARAALTGVVIVVWAASQGWRRWARRRADDLLLRGLRPSSGVDSNEDTPRQDPGRQPMAALWPPGFGAVRRSGPSVAERPWYVVLGDNGSGKQYALGSFGHALRLRQASADGATRATAPPGSRKPAFDVWLFDEAAFVDAAWIGSDRPLDGPDASTAWSRFFSRLASVRPRQPVDGVILMVSVADLMRNDPPLRDDHTAQLRDALMQIQARAQDVGIPLFLMVSQVDLIEGFVETFGDVDALERDSPWGFDIVGEPDARRVGDSDGRSDGHRDGDRHGHSGAAAGSRPSAFDFDGGYSRLEETLRERTVDRMESAVDASTRASLFVFSQEITGLRSVLAQFLAAVLPEGTTGQHGIRLNGVYFVAPGQPPGSKPTGESSAVLPSTPLTRALWRDFGVDPAHTTTALHPRTAGYSFFLRRLLNDVMLAEPGLARRRLASVRRRGQLRLGGYALLGVAATALVAAWLVSFGRNMSYVAEVGSRPAELRRTIDALPPAIDGDVTPLPSILSAVRDMAAPAGFPVGEPPLLDGFGLYQGDKLEAAATIGYEHLLDHALMPRLSHRLEERLQAATRDNPEQAYEALKSYLMVYTPDKFDAEDLGAWIRMDWDESIGDKIGKDARAALDRHLDALLRRGAPKAVTPMNTALVNRTRSLLAQYPLENRVYSRLKRLNASVSLPDFTVAGAVGTQASAVFARSSGQPITRGIPGLFTRDGYNKAFQSSIENLALQLANEETWVLGIGAGDGRGGVAGAVNAAEAAAKRAREIAGGQLSNRVRRLYFDDFIRQWDALIADMRLVNIDNLEKARQLAQTLSATDSPLLPLLRAIARETTLTPQPGLPVKANAALSSALDRAAASRNDAARLSGAEPSALDAGAPTGQVERVVDDHYAALHRLVEGKRAPIEQSLRLFDRVNAQLSEIDLAQRRRTPLPSAGGLADVRAAAASQPEPIRSMLQALANVGAAALAVPSGGTGAPPSAKAPRAP